MSTLSAFPFIGEQSFATPGAFNSPLSIISANIAAINTDVGAISGVTISPPSGNTIQMPSDLSISGYLSVGKGVSIGTQAPSIPEPVALTIGVNSGVSDYIYFNDTSNLRSDYLIGSHAGGTADGLSIYDVSGGTVIVTFSKQSVRFVAPLVGRITDTGGQVLNVKSFGALGDGSADDSGAIQSTIDVTNASGIGGTVYVPSGTYSLLSSLRLGAKTTLQMDSTATLIRNFLGGTGLNATIRNKNQTSTSTDADITIIGGTIITTNMANNGKHVGFSYVSRLQLLDTRISGISADWNIYLQDCQNVIARGLLMDSGVTLGEDGFHVEGGSNIVLSNSVIRAGDDAFAVVEEGAAAAFATTPTSDVAVSNCLLESRAANPIRVHTFNNMTPSNRSIARVSITGCVLRGGTLRGGAIIIVDDTNTGICTDVEVTNCTFDATTQVGDSVDILGAQRVRLAGLKIINPLGRISIDSGAADVTLDDVEITGIRGAANQCVNISATGATTNVQIHGGHFKGATNVGIQVGTGANKCTFFQMVGGIIESATNDGLFINTSDFPSVVGVTSRNNGNYGIKLGASCVAGNIFDNLLGNNGNTGILDSGVVNVKARNRFTANNLQGRAVLVAGTVTVATGEVQAADNINLTVAVLGGIPGHVTIGTIVAGVSFDINSTSAVDTSTVYWELIH